MTEIIYFDIDGTLRNEWQGITRQTASMIRQCKEKNILTVICTGRNPGSIQRDVLELETDGIISGGGCYTRYRESLLKEYCFSNQAKEQLLREVKVKDLATSVETKQNIYMNQKAAEFYKKDYEAKRTGTKTASYHGMVLEHNIHYADNFPLLSKSQEPVHKICLMGEKDVIGSLSETYQESVQIIQKKQWNGQWYLELLPPGCHKGMAVTYLNRYLKIPKENSMSFGDGSNDLDMLLSTGIAVAVENGSPELFAYADSLCSPPEKDGVYKELVKRGILHSEKAMQKKR